jgi:hypothetical protein
MLLRVCLLAVVLACLAPAAGHAAPTWLAPTSLSPVGADAADGNYDVAMSAQGDTLAVWQRGPFLESSFRPAGGTFGPVVPVPNLTGAAAALTPVVAFDGQIGVIVFEQDMNPGFIVARAVRKLDGTFTGARAISSQGRNATGVRLGADVAGDMVAAWQEREGSNYAVAASVRPSGDDFGPLATFPVATTSEVACAMGPGRDALVVWDSGTSISGASRPAGGAFGAAAPLVTAPEDLSAPSVALGAGGAAALTYLRYDATVSGPDPSFGNRRAWAATRAAGAGSFGAPEDVSANGFGTIFTGAAIDGHGDAVAVYQAGVLPWAAVAPPGGTFGDAVRLSPADQDMYAPRVAVAGDGATHVLWSGSGSDGYQVRSVVRPPGGAFASMQTLSGGPAATQYARIAVDGQGNAAAAWRRDEGADRRVAVSGYDAAPPTLRTLEVPAAGVARSALPMSVDAVDVWSPISVAWAFGDGAGGAGAATTHAYTAPGTYSTTVSVVDAVGNAATAVRTVTVTPAPVPAVRDRTKPRLSGLRLTPATFRAAASGGSIAATRIGSTVRYRLSEVAKVKFTVERATAGRRVGGVCRTATPANRRRARCTRYVPLKGSARHKGVAGTNRAAFRGRMGGVRLLPARYRLVARATDPAGNVSSRQRVAFRIVRR